MPAALLKKPLVSQASRTGSSIQDTKTANLSSRVQRPTTLPRSPQLNSTLQTKSRDLALHVPSSSKKLASPKPTAIPLTPTTKLVRLTTRPPAHSPVRTPLATNKSLLNKEIKQSSLKAHTPTSNQSSPKIPSTTKPRERKIQGRENATGPDFSTAPKYSSVKVDREDSVPHSTLVSATCVQIKKNPVAIAEEPKRTAGLRPFTLIDLCKPLNGYDRASPRPVSLDLPNQVAHHPLPKLCQASTSSVPAKAASTYRTDLIDSVEGVRSKKLVSSGWISKDAPMNTKTRNLVVTDEERNPEVHPKTEISNVQVELGTKKLIDISEDENLSSTCFSNIHEHSKVSQRCQDASITSSPPSTVASDSFFASDSDSSRSVYPSTEPSSPDSSGECKNHIDYDSVGKSTNVLDAALASAKASGKSYDVDAKYNDDVFLTANPVKSSEINSMARAVVHRLASNTITSLKRDIKDTKNLTNTSTRSKEDSVPRDGKAEFQDDAISKIVKDVAFSTRAQMEAQQSLFPKKGLKCSSALPSIKEDVTLQNENKDIQVPVQSLDVTPRRANKTRGALCDLEFKGLKSDWRSSEIYGEAYFNDPILKTPLPPLPEKNVSSVAVIPVNSEEDGSSEDVILGGGLGASQPFYITSEDCQPDHRQRYPCIEQKLKQMLIFEGRYSYFDDDQTLGKDKPVDKLLICTGKIPASSAQTLDTTKNAASTTTSDMSASSITHLEDVEADANVVEVKFVVECADGGSIRAPGLYMREKEDDMFIDGRRLSVRWSPKEKQERSKKELPHYLGSVFEWEDDDEVETRDTEDKPSRADGESADTHWTFNSNIKCADGRISDTQVSYIASSDLSTRFSPSLSLDSELALSEAVGAEMSLTYDILTQHFAQTYNISLALATTTIKIDLGGVVFNAPLRDEEDFQRWIFGWLDLVSGGVINLEIEVSVKDYKNFLDSIYVFYSISSVSPIPLSASEASDAQDEVNGTQIVEVNASTPESELKWTVSVLHKSSGGALSKPFVFEIPPNVTDTDYKPVVTESLTLDTLRAAVCSHLHLSRVGLQMRIKAKVGEVEWLAPLRNRRDFDRFVANDEGKSKEGLIELEVSSMIDGEIQDVHVKSVCVTTATTIAPSSEVASVVEHCAVVEELPVSKPIEQPPAKIGEPRVKPRHAPISAKSPPKSSKIPVKQSFYVVSSQKVVSDKDFKIPLGHNPPKPRDLKQTRSLSLINLKSGLNKGGKNVGKGLKRVTMLLRK